jgi:hypothetical protein
MLCYEARCPQQQLHWDYDPGMVEMVRRKPRSAILGMDKGTRLYVYDEELEREVLVPIPPGSILLFDGNVAHRGADYAALNTRIHFYLDVQRVKRAENVTWFKRVCCKAKHV